MEAEKPVKASPKDERAPRPKRSESPAKRIRRVLPPEDELKPWARTLIRLMRERKLKQQTVADATKIDKNTLSALVHGRDTNTRTLATLANYFRVPLADFFGGDKDVSTILSEDATPQELESFVHRLMPYVVIVAGQMKREKLQQYVSNNGSNRYQAAEDEL